MSIDKNAPTALKVENIVKDFYLPHENSNSLKSKFMNLFKKRDNDADIQHALKGVSFEIKKGEFFGIVGRNGSGKSTLLKIIAEIYQPNKGKVTKRGKLVPFIELGVGFNPELTGRENVFLNGALLGFSRKEVEEKYDDIVAFAELEEFMDQKLKNYSSGMQVRLAFSVAIKAQGDILVLDEVLAVGDEAFQRKCFEYFGTLKRNKKTVILVTHSMESVRQFCDRAVLIDKGRIKVEGSPDKVANAYSEIFINEQIADNEKTADEKSTRGRKLSDVVLTDISVLQNSKRTKTVKFREDFSLELVLSTEKAHKDLTMGIHVFDEAGRKMLAISTKVFGELSLKKGKNTIIFDIQNVFTDGNYYVNLAIEKNDNKELLIKSNEALSFSIVGINMSKHSKHSLTYPTIGVRYE